MSASDPKRTLKIELKIVLLDVVVFHLFVFFQLIPFLIFMSEYITILEFTVGIIYIKRITRTNDLVIKCLITNTKNNWYKFCLYSLD